MMAVHKVKEHNWTMNDNTRLPQSDQVVAVHYFTET